MSDGWIKLHRKFTEKGYYKKSQYAHLWVHLLLKANHKPNEFMWNNQIILIKRGQLLTGRKQLAEETGISESTIERILDLFENEQQIEQQKTTKFRVITVINYDEHQDADSKTDNRRTTDGQQTDNRRTQTRMIRMNKNEKNEKNIDFVESEYSECFNDWLQYKKERGQSYKSEKSLKTCYNHLKKIANNNPTTAKEIVEKSIASNYAGLFELKNTKPGQSTNFEDNVGITIG